METIQKLKTSTDLIDSIILIRMKKVSREMELLRLSDYKKVVGNPHRANIEALAKGSVDSK